MRISIQATPQTGDWLQFPRTVYPQTQTIGIDWTRMVWGRGCNIRVNNDRLRSECHETGPSGVVKASVKWTKYRLQELHWHLSNLVIDIVVTYMLPQASCSLLILYLLSKIPIFSWLESILLWWSTFPAEAAAAPLVLCPAPAWLAPPPVMQSTVTHYSMSGHSDMKIRIGLFAVQFNVHILDVKSRFLLKLLHNHIWISAINLNPSLVTITHEHIGLDNLDIWTTTSQIAFQN